MTTGQKKLITFALKYAGNWHSYSPDYFTVAIVSATVNLGIIELNDYGQFKLLSRGKAERILSC